MSEQPNKPSIQHGNSLRYKDAGVDIAAGNELVKRIKPFAASTQRPGVLSGLGGFGGLFELPPGKYQQPVFVSGTDGVGTKLKLAIHLARHDTVGIDLVAMCANDIVVSGAEPLFFLDYYACGNLDIETAEQVVKGIAAGCKQSGAALIGGETAEMPGIYSAHDYDLAGFCVGVVEKTRIIDGKDIDSGDILLGLCSSGPHANGYSLINHLLQETNPDLHQRASKFSELLPGLAAEDGGRSMGELLLTPTRIYVKTILSLLDELPVKGIAHITGGGLLENLPRILPPHLVARIDRESWQIPWIFHWIQQVGGISDMEMLRTFNCGVGMVLCLDPQLARTATELLEAHGEIVLPIGKIATRVGQQPQVVLQ